MQLFNYSSCSTCKKAIKWLKKNSFDFEIIDIVSNPPSKNMLINASKIYGDRKYLLNTSGLSYRSIGAKIIKNMSDEEFFGALIYDPKLIKRPFLSYSSTSYLIGFKENIWTDRLL